MPVPKLTYRLRNHAANQRDKAAQWAARPDFSRWRSDPNGYIEHHLGQTIAPRLREAGEALVTGRRRVLMPSCHKYGKTHYLGGLINWVHDTFDPGIALATSPTSQSLKKQLWREVRRLRRGPGLMPEACEIRHTDSHFVLGLTAQSPEAFQGKHEDSCFIFMDEATGVPWVFWDRSTTMLKDKDGFGWVCAYNPYDPTTEAYFAEQSGLWDVARLSALEHPNMISGLRGEPPVVSAAIELADVVARIVKECEFLGEDEPEDADDSCFEWPPPSIREQVPENAGPLAWGWYRAHTTEFEVQVLGRWPSKAFDQVWGRGDWDKAAKRPVEIDERWPVQIGCDPARGGTNKVGIAVRKGSALVRLELFSVRGKDRPSKVIADRLRVLCDLHAGEGNDARRIPVLIDDSGGYGSGVVDYPDGYNFVPVISSEVANDESLYPNKRSELWWTLRLAADGGLFIASACREGQEHLTMLAGDLQSARYTLDRKQRRVVEGKPAIKARLKRSPDLADAVCLAWYPAP